MFGTNKKRHVYVIVNQDTKNVKIGITDDIKTRVSALQFAGGCFLDVKYLSPKIYDAPIIERELHEHFKEYRYLGEWFKINYKDVLNYIKNKYGDFKAFTDKDDIKDFKQSLENKTPLLATYKHIETTTTITKTIREITRTKQYPFKWLKRIDKNIYADSWGNLKKITYKKGMWEIEELGQKL